VVDGGFICRRHGLGGGGGGVYLRLKIDRVEPYQVAPLNDVGAFGWVELVREFATLIMLCVTGFLAGRSWRTRCGYFAIAFGVWDLGYYGFLKIICGWPHSWLDWDVLFLLPLPWWGPVLAPSLISVLMIIWGSLASQFQTPHYPARAQVRGWALALAGMLLALFVFMADSLAAASRGWEAACAILPARFNWPLFGVAWLLMAAPVLQMFGRWPSMREAGTGADKKTPSKDASQT
jgi:hypothetical protein